MILDGMVETPRLTIRPFVPSDAASLVSVFSDPDVARYVGDGEALSREDAELWVTRSGENLKRHGYGTGAVIDRSSGQLIGWAGYARPQDGPEQIIYGLTAANWDVDSAMKSSRRWSALPMNAASGPSWQRSTKPTRNPSGCWRNTASASASATTVATRRCISMNGPGPDDPDQVFCRFGLAGSVSLSMSLTMPMKPRTKRSM